MDIHPRIPRLGAHIRKNDRRWHMHSVSRLLRLQSDSPRALGGTTDQWRRTSSSRRRLLPRTGLDTGLLLLLCFALPMNRVSTLLSRFSSATNRSTRSMGKRVDSLLTLPIRFSCHAGTTKVKDGTTPWLPTIVRRRNLKLVRERSAKTCSGKCKAIY